MITHNFDGRPTKNCPRSTLLNLTDRIGNGAFSLSSLIFISFLSSLFPQLNSNGAAVNQFCTEILLEDLFYSSEAINL